MDLCVAVNFSTPQYANNIAMQQNIWQNAFVSSTLLLWWIQRNSPELRFFLSQQGFDAGCRVP